jgi:dephospho-CoA kinase
MPGATSDFLFIVVSGMPASGKDSAGDHLAERHGFMHVSASNILRAQAAKEGYQAPYSREILGKVGDELKKKYGAAPVSRKALEQYQTVHNEFPGGLVISGLRRVHEIDFVHENHGLVVFIDSPDERRFEWLKARNRDDEVSIETFKEREAAELKGTTAEGKDGVWIEGVRAKADVIIDNSGSLEDLYKKINKFLVAQRAQL